MKRYGEMQNIKDAYYNLGVMEERQKAEETLEEERQKAEEALEEERQKAEDTLEEERQKAHQKMLETAKALLSKGMSVDMVAEVCGLSIEEVEGLRNK